MSQSEYPIQKEKFEERRAKMQLPRSFHISAIWALECEICLAAYYGNSFRAGCHLIRRFIRQMIVGRYWSAVFRCCDKAGWTRLQAIPETPYFERHSAKCDKMNCNDANCVTSGIPKWFQRLTRIPEEI